MQGPQFLISQNAVVVLCCTGCLAQAAVDSQALHALHDLPMEIFNSEATRRCPKKELPDLQIAWTLFIIVPSGPSLYSQLWCLLWDVTPAHKAGWRIKKWSLLEKRIISWCLPSTRCQGCEDRGDIA